MFYIVLDCSAYDDEYAIVLSCSTLFYIVLSCSAYADSDVIVLSCSTMR